MLRKILDDRGIEYNKLEYFDRGTMGVLYDIGNNKLFKVTTHLEEARTAAWLKEQNIPFLLKSMTFFKLSLMILNIQKV